LRQGRDAAQGASGEEKVTAVHNRIVLLYGALVTLHEKKEVKAFLFVCRGPLS
jgi:hypothetical protein